MNWSNSDKDCAFMCGNNSNFQMDINGFRISIAFGPGMYVNDTSIRFSMSHDEPMKFRNWGTDSAEVRIWGRDGVPIKWDGGDTVVGWLSSDTVARLIGCMINCPQDEDPVKALNQIVNAQIQSDLSN